MMNKLKRAILHFNIKHGRKIQDSFRALGMTIGADSNVYCDIPKEPYLIKIGNHSTIASDVFFCTHDAAIGALTDRNEYSDLVGEIVIGDNCFVGAKAIIMCGVTIADRVIVAAGSVVTKSVLTPGVIVGGNPARIIGKTEDYVNKYNDSFLSLHGLSPEERKIIILNTEKKICR